MRDCLHWYGFALLPSSWTNWADFFRRAGYAPLTPDCPDDPETRARASSTSATNNAIVNRT